MHWEIEGWTCQRTHTSVKVLALLGIDCSRLFVANLNAVLS